MKVPFPYTDRPVQQRRPALVVALSGGTSSVRLAWVLMITSAQHRAWPGDVPVSDLGRAGLPAPSVVRCMKIATIEAGSMVVLGSLHPTDREPVRTWLRQWLAGLDGV